MYKEFTANRKKLEQLFETIVWIELEYFDAENGPNRVQHFMDEFGVKYPKNWLQDEEFDCRGKLIEATKKYVNDRATSDKKVILQSDELLFVLDTFGFSYRHFSRYVSDIDGLEDLEALETSFHKFYGSLGRHGDCWV